MFASSGEVVRINMLKYPDTGNSKGAGFITFADEAAVANALKQNGAEVSG